MNIRVDTVFRNLIPPLTREEYEQLEENILQEGCRDALVTWNGLILDGHNRYEICTKHGIDFDVYEMDFDSEEEAKEWLDKNQLGRRNLTPDQRRVIIGRRYNREKKNIGERGPKKIDQNDPSFTADRIARESGVSPPSVKRYAKDAEFFDELEEKNPELAYKVWSGETTLRDVKREEKKSEQIKRFEELKEKECLPPTGKYDVIVIDPPWPMQKIDRDVTPNQTGFDYPTMTEQEITEIEMPAEKDCHLFMWTTQTFLPMAIRIVEAWNFKYTLTLVWHKNGGFQPFRLPQYNCEFCIYARKGNPQFIETKDFFTCFNAPRKTHSEKPDEFYNLIRRVTAGKRIDMFNRRKINGFDVWGNERGN